MGFSDSDTSIVAVTARPVSRGRRMSAVLLLAWACVMSAWALRSIWLLGSGVSNLRGRLAPIPARVLSRAAAVSLPRLTVVAAPLGRESEWNLGDWTGLVFVYTSTCEFCRANMSNWLDLAAFLGERRVHVVALAPGDSIAHWREWRYVGPSVALYSLPHDRDLLRLLARPVVPTTIVVINGRVQQLYQGVLWPAAKESIVQGLLGRTAARTFAGETGS